MAQNPMKNQGPDTPNAQQNRQAGSVLTIILIAVALFAALSWAMTQGSRTTGSLATDQNAKLAASEIIEYANLVRDTVKALRIKGCADTHINFYSTQNDVDYTNPGAPADKSCDVFSKNGGGINSIQKNPDWLDGSGLGSKYFRYYIYCVYDVGTGTSTCNNSELDLTLFVGRLSKQVCTKINEILGITSAGEDPPGETLTGTSFFGTYTNASAYAVKMLGESNPALAKKNAACLYGTGGSETGTYMFYQVLIAR